MRWVYSDVVFERFTEHARQAIVIAHEETLALGHSTLGSEHLLLGLMREEDGPAGRVLRDLGVGIEHMRALIPASEELHGSESAGGHQTPFSADATATLQLALNEAMTLGHSYVGTEHLLLAVARESDGLGGRILRDMGVDAEKLRVELIRTVGEPGARPPRMGLDGPDGPAHVSESRES
jgi:ATP-dependent Clp protease ATP-binding subunit ClpC